jgi:hypothetical protein
VRLARRSGTELDELLRLDRCDYLRSDSIENLLLRASRVVLRERRDVFEQSRSALVVEVLGRQFLRLCREAGANVFGQVGEVLVAPVNVDADLFLRRGG